VIEHWDVLQEEIPAAQTVARNPMFTREYAALVEGEAERFNTCRAGALNNGRNSALGPQKRSLPHLTRPESWLSEPAPLVAINCGRRRRPLLRGRADRVVDQSETHPAPATS
jgi:hypothetical protein